MSPCHRTQRGFSLIVALIMLSVLTLLSLGMFRSFGLQERIAGNTRDKQRAFEAAQSALQYGEWWLGQGNGGTGTPCTAEVDLSVPGNSLQVCSNPLAAGAAGKPTAWPGRFDYLPPGMSVNASGGLATGGDPAYPDINYQAKPQLFISYLGLTPDGLAQLYRVTAAGSGGNPDTAAVVQSTYQIATGVKDLGGL